MKTTKSSSACLTDQSDRGCCHISCISQGYLTRLTSSSNKHVLFSLQTKPTLQSQTEKTRVFSLETILGALIVCVLWLVAFDTLMCVYWGHTYFIFYSDSLPSTGTLNNGSTVPTVVRQKRCFSPSLPLLHHRLSVALGLLNDDLLLFRKEHLYILPAGAWWNRDMSGKDQLIHTHVHRTGDWDTAASQQI